MSTNHLELPAGAGPSVMVIFGATGDLTKRKLIPALLNLAQEGSCPSNSPSWVLLLTTSRPRPSERGSANRCRSLRLIPST